MKKSQPTEIPLPCPVYGLLPHRPPMLLVEALEARDGNRATVRAVLPAAGIGVSDGRLLPEYLIELIAQAAAAKSGYDALSLGRPAGGGMLAGVDGFAFPGLAVPGRVVRIETEEKCAFGAIRLIHGEVFDGDELLAAGDIKVWEDVDPDGKR